MATVETVRGPVDTSRLGQVLMHEHVFVLSTELAANYDTGWDEEERVAEAIARLKELKANGIDTIVDLTVAGLGRYIPRIQRINAETDLNIVVATGSTRTTTCRTTSTSVGQGGCSMSPNSSSRCSCTT